MRRSSKLLALSAFCAAILHVSVARAIPVLEFEFVGSGQTVSPTDSVIMQGRVTNTGDMALTDAVAFGGIDVFNEAPKIFNNYVEFLSGGFKFGPAGPFSIEPGESVLFTIATWDPWPIAGDPGDPVETGEYVLPISALSLTYDTFTPFTEYPVDMSGAGNFVWQVQEPGSTGGTPTDSAVPEPLTATLSLLAIGGAIVSLRRRPELRN